MSDFRILSSKVARKAPGGALFMEEEFVTAFLIWPRMPDTVRMAAPWNLATSSWLLNMSRMKAVLRATTQTQRHTVTRSHGQGQDGAAAGRRWQYEVQGLWTSHSTVLARESGSQGVGTHSTYLCKDVR